MSHPYNYQSGLQFLVMPSSAVRRRRLIEST